VTTHKTQLHYGHGTRNREARTAVRCWIKLFCWPCVGGMDLLTTVSHVNSSLNSRERSQFDEHGVYEIYDKCVRCMYDVRRERARGDDKITRIRCGIDHRGDV